MATLTMPAAHPAGLDRAGAPGAAAAAGSGTNARRKRPFTAIERQGHSVVEKRRRENLNQKLLVRLSGWCQSVCLVEIPVYSFSLATCPRWRA